MPCPEMTYTGTMRWGHVKVQYDSPMFRRHYQRLADQVMDQAEDYRRNGYKVLGFVMVDGTLLARSTRRLNRLKLIPRGVA